MQFWLSYNNNAERLQLPVNPNTIHVATSHGYDDITVNNLGDYTIIGDKKAVEISFSSLFPRDYNASYCEYMQIPNPYTAVNTIIRWMNSRNPIRLIVTDTNLNYAVTIRDFTYEERGGSPGDVYFDLTLREYTFIKVRTIDTSSQTIAVVSSSTNKRPDTRETPKSYTVKSGDTLWKIAQVSLGNGDNWRDIYEKNKALIGNNPNQIKPGMKLSLA